VVFYVLELSAFYLCSSFVRHATATVFVSQLPACGVGCSAHTSLRIAAARGRKYGNLAFIDEEKKTLFFSSTCFEYQFTTSQNPNKL
jgi:hypothetical protein